MSVGLAGLEIGSSHTVKTSFGYSITVDPKDDPDGRIVEALAACRTAMQYEVFIATHCLKVTVTGRTAGKGSADATSIGVSVGPVKAGIGTHQGVEEETRTDGKGKLVKKKVVGKAGAGGNIGSISDSVDEEGVAEIDGQGNATLTLTRTSNDSNSGEAFKRKAARLAGAGLPGKGGALAALAGGDDEGTATSDVSGIRLGNKDLRRIGGIACRSMGAWMGAIRRTDEKTDWKAAGQAIARGKGTPAVVAEQLARFIGGDRVERLATVELFLRGGHDKTIGSAYEFPHALRSLQADYDKVTAESLPAQLDKLASTDAAKAVEECKRLAAIADVLDQKIRASNDFANKAAKMEMLQRIVRRRKDLAEGIKGYAGDNHPENDPKLLEQSRERLTTQCGTFFREQARLHGELTDLMDGETYFLARDKGKARAIVRRLDDLHQRWWVDYRELKSTAGKMGMPNYDVPMFRPDESLLQHFEKKLDM